MNTGPQAALLKGVEATLRAWLAETPADGRTPASEVGLTDPDGKPMPGAWTWFYGVCGTAISGKGRSAEYLDRVYGCRVVLTMRLHGVPEDRIGYELLAKERAGIHDRVDAMVKFVHANYAGVYAAANAALDLATDTRQGFHEPLYFTDATVPAKKGGRWFGSAAEKSDKAQGYAVVASFAGARFTEGLLGEWA